MIKLCLFDLDQTLVDTEDMKEIRERGVNRKDAEYIQEVRIAYNSRDRVLIDDVSIWLLGLNTPELKLGVITRAPRSYTETILQSTYIATDWDVIICYEDVQHSKPNREGIYKAMKAVGLNNVRHLPEVMLVGDSDVDIRAAYHAGCNAVLFKGGWPRKLGTSHWKSLDLLPEASLEKTAELDAILTNPSANLPYLECLLEGSKPAQDKPRFDRINKFFPWEDKDRSPYMIYAAGRSFAGYKNLDARREWHNLSKSIRDHKDSEVFPSEWIASIKQFIASHYKFTACSPFNSELVITVIPPRPGRKHRLAHLLSQLEHSYGITPRLNSIMLRFDPDVLAYVTGVRSHSREHLNPEDRFANVRDHMVVSKPAEAQGRKFLVIDDVSTTGATLLYAKRYLTQAGASAVDCFTIAMNISDPLRYQ